MIARSFLVAVLGDVATWIGDLAVTLDRRWGTDIWKGAR